MMNKSAEVFKSEWCDDFINSLNQGFELDAIQCKKKKNDKSVDLLSLLNHQTD